MKTAHHKFSLFVFVCTIILGYGQNSWKREITELHPEWKVYFDQCKTDGAIALYDYQNKKWLISDSVLVKKETLPASTFKIPNLLIALETKVIRTENDTIKWTGKTDTVKYGYRPDIYHDTTPKEAFENSSV